MQKHLNRCHYLFHFLYRSQTKTSILQISISMQEIARVCWEFLQLSWKISFVLFKVLLPAGMDASEMHLWDVSCSVSETSQREMMCKSLRHLPGECLEMSPQRRLWVAYEDAILGLQTKPYFGYLFIYLRVFKHFVKLILSCLEFGLN